MSAALRLTTGFVRLDRAWSYSPKSPFAKRRRYLKVWQVLIDQAGYVGCKSLELGVVQITLRQIAASAQMPTMTVARAVAWLRRHRWIVVQSVKRCHSILIPHYELLHDMDAYILSRLRGSIVENVDKSGTNSTGDNTTESKPVLRLVETKRYKVDKSGTNLASTEQSPTIENDSQKDLSKDGLGTKTVQTFALLKELTTEEINIIPATQTAACCAEHQHNNPHTEDSIDERSVESESSDNATDDINEADVSKSQLTEFDIEIAEMWRDGIAEVDEELGRPSRRIKIKEWANVVRLMREQDGLTEKAIYYMTLFRFEDEFYRTSGMGLGNLRSRSANGLRKSDNLLERARAAHRRKKQQKRPDFDLGQIVGIDIKPEDL